MIPHALASDVLFKSIFDAAALGVAIVDHDGRFVTCNAAFQKLFGYTEDELSGRSLADVTHPDDMAAHKTVLAELLNGGRDSFELSKRYVRRDGRVIHGQITVSRVHDIYVLGVLKDVTAEWEAREEHERLLPRLEKRVKELSALHDAAQLLEQNDISPVHLLNQFARIVAAAFDDPEHTVARITYGSVVAETPGFRTPRLQLSTGFVTSDGTHASIEVGYARDQRLARREPFLDEERALIGTLAEMLHARLDRTVAEQRLRHSQEQLGVVMASVDMGFWEWDVQTDRMVWSDEMARLVGLPAPVSGRFGERFHLIHPDDVQQVRAVVHDALMDKTCATQEHEFRILRPDGQERWVYVKAHIFRGPTGIPQRLVGVIIDATVRRRLQEQLLEAQKLDAIGRFARGIAHDFNNALTVIVGQCDVLRTTDPSPDGLRHGLGEIAEAAERAAHLTQQLLTFSRSGRTNPTALDATDVVRRLAIFLRALTSSHDLRFELVSPLAAIRIDRRQLEQVIVNPVVNARDAMPTPGHIVVTTGTTPEGQVVISVRDSGIGMDEETVARVFEPFFTTKAPGQGTGLGLAVVYSVVEEAGGTVQLDTAPGQGTTVELRFPRAT